MKQFKLILKRPDNSQEFQDLSNKIMSCLRKDFDLADEPEFANTTLHELLGNDLKTLSLLVNGNDFPSSVDALKELILVGDQYGGVDNEYCPACGHPDYYYTGGMMLCPQCEFSEHAEAPFYDGDITDYSGYTTIDRNQVR